MTAIVLVPVTCGHKISEMSSEQHATSFAELPGEIRLQIYRHLLQDIGLNITIRDERLQLQEPRKTGNLLYVLLSCRQV